MVQSLGGGGGLTTAQLDTALATQTTAIDTSLATQTTTLDTSLATQTTTLDTAIYTNLVSQLDSTSRNLMRLRTFTINKGNCSSTATGAPHGPLLQAELFISADQNYYPSHAPDIDMTDQFIIMCMNGFFTLANSDPTNLAYATMKVLNTMDAAISVPYETAAASAKWSSLVQWPMSWPIVPEFPTYTGPSPPSFPAYTMPNILVEIWGNVQLSGTMSAIDCTFVYYLIKGA